MEARFMNYKIGEFSKITMLTVKTLRYYHEIGLLEPSVICEESGYRYYDATQIKEANLIKLLRAYEFSVKEVQEIMSTYEDESDIQAYLKEQHDAFERKIRRYRELQKKIDNYSIDKEGTHMAQKAIIEKNIESLRIISVTYTGKYQDVGPYIGQLCKVAGPNAAGAPFCLYHDGEYKEDATIEVCLPVKKEIVKKDITNKMLEGGKAITIEHVGPYENLGSSYKAITDYANENNIRTKLPTREHYVKGPGMLLKGNPKKYRTEIQFMVEV